MSDKPQIIIVHETLWQSIGRDAVSVLACLAMILPGWWLGSDALQWVGALLFMIMILGKAAGTAKRCTIAEARAVLDFLDPPRKASQDAAGE